MTIVASGEISLGGNATATRSIACEISQSTTNQISMDSFALRTLAGRTTAASAICMNDFYGKTAGGPTDYGQFWYGGYYMGVTYANCLAYHLVVAPNASGCAACQWKTTNTASGQLYNNPSLNCDNGYWNTFTYLNNASHPAGNWTATRTIGGFSDWYLPSRNELQMMYQRNSTINQWGVFETWATDRYWSSSEDNDNLARKIEFPAQGRAYFSYKNCTYKVRAVRRSTFTPSAPKALGEYIYGGYYMGTITSPANYYLIVAPNSIGCVQCTWKTNLSCTNNSSNSTCNNNNGYWNTFTYLNNTSHPAGNFAATRTIGGFTDWYLPSITELNVLYQNKNSLPIGEKMVNSCFWSSTEKDQMQACKLQFYRGYLYYQAKTNIRCTRIVRRVTV